LTFRDQIKQFRDAILGNVPFPLNPNFKLNIKRIL